MNERKTYAGLAKFSSTYVGKQRGPVCAPKPPQALKRGT